MANRSGLLLTAALIALLSAPAWAAGDEPVATAPIPPPPASPPTASPPVAARAAPSAPDAPAFVKPTAPKPSPPKATAAPAHTTTAPTTTAAAPPKRPVRSAAKVEPGKKHADRHRPSRQAKKDKEKEHQHTAAQAATTPPVRKASPRPRYYADYAPPPPPWYGPEVPFAGYYPGPWRRGPVMMPW